MKNNEIKFTAEEAVLPVDALHPFENHPYKVLDNEELEELAESIRENGIMTPLIVRPLENSNGEFEVISGHRRLYAAKKAGLNEVPAIICDMDRDTASVAVVDSNMHREHILPSEKAFAYKMKMDAISHQGIACGQVGHKSREEISEAESGRQVQRYLRLTHLIPELLKQIDDGKMAFSVGVELSYLPEEVQHIVAEAGDYYDCTPSYSQAVKLRKSIKDITTEEIYELLGEEKANQRVKVSFKTDELDKYFNSSSSPDEMKNKILKLLEADYQRQRRNREYER